MRAAWGLIGTGVLAGAVVGASFLLATRIDGGSGEEWAVTTVVGLLGCLALLAWSWRPLAAQSRTGAVLVVPAIVVTAVLVPVVFVVTLGLAFMPYDALMCDGAAGDSWCGIELIVLWPTFGAVVPWTIAGLPALLSLIFAARSAIGIPPVMPMAV